MKLYAKGARLENKARHVLEEEGYSVMRSAGSKGDFDLCAWNRYSVRFIQCKSANDANKKAWARLDNAVVPLSAVKEMWVWWGREGWAITEVE